MVPPPESHGALTQKEPNIKLGGNPEPNRTIRTSIRKVPRGGLDPNQGFVELGAFRTKRLRRLPQIEMFKWNSISEKIRAEIESAKPKRDRMRLAYEYQSMLDSGAAKSRAELARKVGVSRARVTQVLRRLQTEHDAS